MPGPARRSPLRRRWRSRKPTSLICARSETRSLLLGLTVRWTLAGDRRPLRGRRPTSFPDAAGNVEAQLEELLRIDGRTMSSAVGVRLMFRDAVKINERSPLMTMDSAPMAGALVRCLGDLMIVLDARS